MTQEEKRIKIAEACGWENIFYRGVHGRPGSDYVGDHQNCRPEGATGIWSGALPDYFNDLNACHEMEKVLDEDQWDVFADRLDDMTMYNHGHASRAAHATAAQRAEAFGLTLGLWTA